jgi:hypothetical protein
MIEVTPSPSLPLAAGRALWLLPFGNETDRLFAGRGQTSRRHTIAGRSRLECRVAANRRIAIRHWQLRPWTSSSPSTRT